MLLRLPDTEQITYDLPFTLGDSRGDYGLIGTAAEPSDVSLSYHYASFIPLRQGYNAD